MSAISYNKSEKVCDQSSSLDLILVKRHGLTLCPRVLSRDCTGNIEAVKFYKPKQMHLAATNAASFHEESRFDKVSDQSRPLSDQETCDNDSVGTHDDPSLEDRIFSQLKEMGGCCIGELEESEFDDGVQNNDTCTEHFAPLEAQKQLESPKYHRQAANGSDQDTGTARWTARSSEDPIGDDQMSLSEYDSTDEDWPASACSNDPTNLSEFFCDEDDGGDTGAMNRAQGWEARFSS